METLFCLSGATRVIDIVVSVSLASLRVNIFKMMGVASTR